MSLCVGLKLNKSATFFNRIRFKSEERNGRTADFCISNNRIRVIFLPDFSKFNLIIFFIKILHLPSSYFPASTGGKEVLVNQWIRHTSSAEVEHKILIHGPQANTYTYEGVEVIVLPWPQPRTHETYFSKIYSDLSGFKEYLRVYQPDVVHFHDQNESGSLSHLRICKELQIKTIVTYHSPGQSCMQRAQLFAGKSPCDARIDITRCTSCRYQLKGVPSLFADVLGSIHLPLVKKSKLNLRHSTQLFYESWKEFYQQVDQVHIYSRWLEKVLHTNGVQANKIMYTEMGGHEGQESVSHAEHLEGQPLRLVFIGRCTPVKGVHLLVDAVKKLPAGLAVEIHFFGPYFDNSEYGQMLKQKISGDARFVMPRLVPPAQVINELMKMDVCVIPSLWPETGPLTVFDAFAAGLPIIGTNHAGIAERVRDKVDGLLFNWGDANDLADKIQMLVINRELLLTLRRGLKRKPTFHDMSLSILDMYNTLKK
jgi:glycosyltransferase involved in cell wall biosynthesis